MIFKSRCKNPVAVGRNSVTCVLTLLSAGLLKANDESAHFFETEVRPLLIEKCSDCHGETEQSGGLRVDSREALLQGGDTGPALVPGDPDGSLIIRAIRRDGDLQMPPDNTLSAAQVASLSKWVQQGAVWPKERSPVKRAPADVAKDHWAFQPIRDPDVPKVEMSAWIRTPVDAFVAAKWTEADLSPAPEADSRTLIRRLTYTLTGLPPSAEEVNDFVNNPDPLAYEQLVDRLLDSPHYGEHWARHWLDIARYADTKGYVYAREERFWVHAWGYRDWVARALNADMPYDRFLLLQLAADQVPDRNNGDLAAMGFLTLGRRFLGVERDIIDDRIDVVSRGTMGLTVGCARCHDHKYDPIPTADYYSLYGVFDSCAERLVPLDSPENEEFVKGLKERQEKLETTRAQRRAESSARVRARVGDYLFAQTELDKYPAKGFDQVFQDDDILPAFVRRWEAYLREAGHNADPIFVPWHAYADLSDDEFADRAESVTQQLQASSPGMINPLVAEAFASPPASFAEVIERYAALFRDIDAHWQAALEQASETEPPTALEDPPAEQLRHVLYGPTAPCEVPDESITSIESFVPSGVCTELWKLRGEVDRWIINSPVEPAYALTLVDRPRPSEPRIMVRGNPLNLGDDIPRQFLSAISGEDRQPFQEGSGRKELADAIIDPTNPLTARVIVNRLWMHHFGEGLVTTPSDFGTRAPNPSHPDLLDWLASRLIDSGWSLKTIHRLILNSAAYRQSSRGPDDPDLLTEAQMADPTNRLLWRMNEHRLTFEEFRDSLLAASGELDLRVGGKPEALFKTPFPVRRTLYGLVDRQFLPSTLRMFDFANPDLHTPQRPETTVPQQALFLMNDPLILEQARALAETTAVVPSSEERIQQLFERTLQREPSDRELSDSLQLVTAASRFTLPSPPATAAAWQYGYGALIEESMRIDGFTPLPHFTGTAWQGGPAYPDGKLGWVQLTATGGHPGNDRQHASIRRWTAPRAMTVDIRSKLNHDAAPGDGIRAFIVSSRTGELASETAHQRAVDMNVESLSVEAGETLDFLVDIGDVLNSDQHLWSVKINEQGGSEQPIVWNSKTDFDPETVEPLTEWEQLAQVLLCSNEFLFLD